MINGSLKKGIGGSILRFEDHRLLTGRSSYIADIAPAGLWEVAFFAQPGCACQYREFGETATGCEQGIFSCRSRGHPADSGPLTGDWVPPF